MKPLEFLQPKSLEEVCGLLSEYGKDAKLLAGGQSLRPLLRQGFLSPKFLVNLKSVSELDYIREDADGLRIGAVTTERSIETSPVIARSCLLLQEMTWHLGSLQIRNWGTIGGSLCFSDPSGDPAVALLALDAHLQLVSSRGFRDVPLADFETGYMDNVLEEDEVLAEIRVPCLPSRAGTAFMEEVVRAGDLGIGILAAVVILDEANRVEQARIAVGAQSVPPTRASEAEALLVGRECGDSLEDIADSVARFSHFQSDVLGSIEYKKEIIKVLTRRALNVATSRALDNCN